MARQPLAFLTILSLLVLSAADFARAEGTGAKPAAAKPSAKPQTSESEAKGDKIEWLSFDVATEKAVKEDKHVIVDIYTTWCGWCKVMDRQTYGNPEVAAYLRDNFVLAKVNGEASGKIHWQGKEITEKQLARAFGVTGYPATYFLKPNAELLGGVSGYIEHSDFMIYARYVHTRWYEKGKISDYADSLRSTR